ncbi:hypothetical protein EauS123_00022 [Exiguobacterium phage vB_EauS-123]|nr:hypothetical protein EauS123_00022 [Exiguobacterium phage vB_EauS-123]
MNSLTLVQLIELNRRAQGYAPSPVTLPEAKPKTVKTIDAADVLNLMNKWKTQMERKGESLDAK